MDLLSQALAATHLQSSLLAILDAAAPWAIDFEKGSGSPTHYVRSGEVWFECPPDPPQRLLAGDLVMLPRWNRYQLSSSPDLAAQPIRPLVMDAGDRPWVPGELLDGPMKVEVKGEGPVSRVLSMAFRLHNHDTNPLILGLPRVVLIRGADRIMSGLLEPALLFIGAEAAERRPGYAVASNRLAELLFIQIVRWQIQTAPHEMTGMLRGLSEPGIGRALAAMHAQPQHPWTIASLAHMAGMSRTIFATRFRDLTGSTVLTYLTRLRVERARALLDEGASLKSAAVATGYTTGVALTKAFERVAVERPRRRPVRATSGN